MGNILPGVPTPTPKCDSCCPPAAPCPACNSCCPKPTPCPPPVICPPATQQSAVWCNGQMFESSGVKYDMPTTDSGMCVCNPAGKYPMLQDCQRDLVSLEQSCASMPYSSCAAPCVQVGGQLCVSPYSPYSHIIVQRVNVENNHQLTVNGQMRFGPSDIIKAIINDGQIRVPEDGIKVSPNGILITLTNDIFMANRVYQIRFEITNAETGKTYRTPPYNFEVSAAAITPDSRRYAY